jgi:hypothetical protein
VGSTGLRFQVLKTLGSVVAVSDETLCSTKEVAAWRGARVPSPPCVSGPSKDEGLERPRRKNDLVEEPGHLALAEDDRVLPGGPIAEDRVLGPEAAQRGHGQLHPGPR